MDKESAIVLLEHLRDRISSLQEFSELNDTFYEWHTEALRATVRVFGSQSTEAKEFQQIRFQLDPDISRSFRERTRDLLEKDVPPASFDDTDIDEGLYYRQRLYEASEFLLGLISSLKSRH